VFRRGFLGEVLDLDGLDSDAAVEVGIAPLIHDPHRALPEDTNELVAAEFLETHGTARRGKLKAHSSGSLSSGGKGLSGPCDAGHCFFFSRRMRTLSRR